MGTVLHERLSQQSVDKVFTRDRDWKKRTKAPWSSSNNNNNNRPNVYSNKMGRRQPQRKPQQPQPPTASQENNHNNEKRLQQRRKHKPHAALTRRTSAQHSAQGNVESKPRPVSPAEGRMVSKVQSTSQRSARFEQKHPGFRGSRHTPSISRHRLSDPSPDPPERRSPALEAGRPSSHGDGDSDTDLSESERLPVSSSVRVPPQLELRPDTIESEDRSTRSYRFRGHRGGRSGFDFPDFLPPPFNSWSLGQLAVFYNTEGLGAPRPRPVGCLERYLERLLQLEWHQIQTVQEETGRTAVTDVISSCHRSPAAASSRLSSPKCILQCQRAFPLTFLSSLASHTTLLSGCTCSMYRQRHSTHSHARQSRLSPTPERRGPVSLPKRSYSESRVHSSDRNPAASRAQRFSSPVRTNSHLRRMQASGNIRNPVQGANATTHPTARDWSAGVSRNCLGTLGEVLDYRTGRFRTRSGSEQRRGLAEERQLHRSEKRRSGSECRRGGRTIEFTEREIKPDAVAAIMDNLPASKYSAVNRTNRHKQVEFAT